MQEIFDYLRQVDPLLSGAFGFLCGALIGNRLALGLERRREFNAYAAPIRERLIRIRDHNPLGYLGISAGEIDYLGAYMWPLQRHRLASALERCAEAYKSQQRRSPEGLAYLVDPETVQKAISEILSIIPLR